ncbi:hypothetical protein K431DRAFT_281919 [Polychaeton citri CBS 116435]|uniref:Acid phosphatase-like protein n=1 Tax=Polychaeton citri CBS 116435 TaxID=1314669 RepID=A0A9P4QC39_9PEZI|nr:hypothetical protein K431DRAFT_281919 [Polychaeton citri CBS 116435]
MNGWGIFFIILVILVIFGSVGWILYTHIRARRLGLPPPSLNPFAARRNNAAGGGPNYRVPAPAPGGIQGWFSDKFAALRNGRSAGGAYESAGYGGRSRRGFGPLDPDEAWDARVGNEAEDAYDEQELGLQDPAHGPYGGGGYGAGAPVGVGGIPVERGRSRERERELDERYDQEVHGGGQQRLNPFGDHAEANSLRAASPRPLEEGGRPHSRGISSHRPGQSSLGGGGDESPTERRSMFREDVS